MLGTEVTSIEFVGELDGVDGGLAVLERHDCAVLDEHEEGTFVCAQVARQRMKEVRQVCQGAIP